MHSPAAGRSYRRQRSPNPPDKLCQAHQEHAGCAVRFANRVGL